MRDRQDLRPYQKRLAQMMVDEPIKYLALTPGMGKTATVITALRDLFDAQEVTQCLIIAPLLVADTVWPVELREWRQGLPLSFEVLTGSEDRRLSRMRRANRDIHIINRENVPWLVEQWGDGWPYDVMVIDEADSFKNHTKRRDPTPTAIDAAVLKAKRSLPSDATAEQIDKATQSAINALPRPFTRFGALASIRKHVKRVYLLGGTPAPNGVKDLWSQIYLLDQGERLGKNITAFNNRWFSSDPSGYGYLPREGATQEIMAKVSDVMVSLNADDYVTLPPLIMNTINVELSPRVMAQYRAFKKTLLLEEHDIEAVNNAVLCQKLLQFSNGSCYDENGDDKFVHHHKLDALEAIVNESQGENLLVAFSYKFDQSSIKRKFPHAVVLNDEPNAIKRWNAGKIRMAIAHPASVGHGLNLQTGGCTAVWYGLNYSLGLYQQFNKRLHRPGQTRPVVIHHILANGTIDHKVLAILQSKTAVQDDVMRLIQQDMRE